MDVNGGEGESNGFQQVITKKPFAFRNNENGILLTIHHTEVDGNEIKRIPFWHVVFSDLNDCIAAIDGRGNAFIFDVRTIEFWRLSNVTLDCSTAKFHPTSKNAIVFGTKRGDITLLDLSTGNTLNHVKLFASKIINISFPPLTKSSNTFLCATAAECIICDMDTLQPIQKLLNVSSIPSYTINLTIKDIRYLPMTATNAQTVQIFALLSDDSIYIWSEDISEVTEADEGTQPQAMFRIKKHIRPIELRDEYLQNFKPLKIQKSHLLNGQNEESRVTQFVHKIIRDYSKGLVSCICFSSDGRRMIIGTVDDCILIFETEKWDLLSTFQSPGGGMLRCESIPDVRGSFANFNGKYILSSILTNKTLALIEIDSENGITALGVLEKSSVLKQTISKNGNMLANVSENGKVYIYNIPVILKNLTKGTKGSGLSTTVIKNKDEKKRINEQINNTLPRDRLLGILREYGEYPKKYRRVIWKTILKLPENANAFTELLKKGTHPCAQDFDQTFPLRDVTALRNLKKICSCLAHWCKIFGQFNTDMNDMGPNFLPSFVFPFIKIFENNSIAAFETIATILVNQCQLWFEFSPLEPINYLGMVENILNYFEPTLVAHYKAKSVTTKTYAWKTLQSVFTEVLDEEQWFRLWDNVISNPSYFLLFAMIAYNIVQRPVIIRLKSKYEIEAFFDEQNNIDMRKFIEKTYWLMDKCPEHLHPKRYMFEFDPLQRGQYQKIVNFPKVLVNVRNAQMEELKSENKILNEKLFQMEKSERSLMDRLTNDWRREEHERRLMAVEKLYEETLLREEERVAYQRKQLLLYQRQLRDRENQVMEAARQGKQERVVTDRQDELNAFVNELERNKIREETDLLLAEENLRRREMDLLLRTREADYKPMEDRTLASKFQKPTRNLQKERRKLRAEILKLQKHGSSFEKTSEDKVHAKIGTLEDVTERLEKAVRTALNIQ